MKKPTPKSQLKQHYEKRRLKHYPVEKPESKLAEYRGEIIDWEWNET